MALLNSLQIIPILTNSLSHCRCVNILFLLPILFLPVLGHSGRCDQTPPNAKVLTPSEIEGVYQLSFETKDNDQKNLYLPDQTYVLKLFTTNETRPFRWFMITAEDPDVDNSIHNFDNKAVDVGSLKTLDTDRHSRYSERCYSSVENADSSDKYVVEVHWVSPKQSDKKQKVRLRAMIAENEEVWYTGDNLTIILNKNEHRLLDTPPYMPRADCNLCSEARYEVIFKGRWSRGNHPWHYPSKPDENGYSHMIGCSHAIDYTLWQQGTKASPGLVQLAVEGNITLLETEIIKAMADQYGTRTLIKGKRRHHPDYMSEPSHSLFRVDRIHHLFSIAVAMRPSPDWFLGTSMFELCTDDGWLEESEIGLYPWDAGRMDGISYESPRSLTQPEDNVERVAVGSFDRESPFYQMNLNNLKPFAYLEVRRLDVYPLVGVNCVEENEEGDQNKEEAEIKEDENDEHKAEEEAEDEPQVAEARRQYDAESCGVSEWSEWSPCKPQEGSCGIGTQTRTRHKQDRDVYYTSYNVDRDDNIDIYGKECPKTRAEPLLQTQHCFVDCYYIDK